MYFCPFCSSLLLINQPQQVQLACSACPYVYKIMNTIVNEDKRDLKIIDKIVDAKDELKYGNKCTINCPKCPNNEALFMELQTRSADEPMTIFYRCTKCRHNWKE